jgi:hypothetical protein
MNEIETKRKKYDLVFKTILIGIGALVISPVIFMVVKGLAGAVVACGIGLVVVNAAPWFSMKLANWKVKAIIAEAKENPIETMVNLLAEKRKAFQQFKISVEEAVTASKVFRQQTTEFAKKYPNRALEFTKQSDDMEVLIQRKVTALKEAQTMLAVGEEKLVEMRSYWEMSKAAIAANKAAGMDTGDLFEKLKSDTAVTSVFESMHRAFAELEVASALAEPAQLTNESSPVLGTVINVKTKVV